MILDQHGQPIVTQYRHAYAAAQSDASRPYFHSKLADFDDLIPEIDRKRLVGISQRLFDNFGICRAAITQKANYATVNGWKLVFKGQNTAWGDQAVALVRRWFENCDVRGAAYPWQNLLRLFSIAIDRDGDFFILQTRAESGWPLVQIIPSHRVGTRPDKVDANDRLKEGRFKGQKIRHGVIQNKFGRPIAYNIFGDKPEDDRQIPAAQMVHVINPTYFQQSRGTPLFIAGLNDCRDSLQSTEWEKNAMLALSAISMVEYNEHGAGDPDDPANFRQSTASDCNTGVQLRELAGGAYRYFRSNSGDKIEQLAQTRPTDLWQKFQDRLTRSILAGAGWPRSFVDVATGQGTAERADIQRAAAAVTERQLLLLNPALRVVRWAVANFIQVGQLPAPDSPADWLRFAFTMPPKLSIDNGRDARAQLELWRSGAINQSDIVAERGDDYEEHCIARAYEVATRKRIAREVSEATGQEVTPEEMALLTLQGTPGETSLNPEKKEESNNDND